MKVDWDKLRRLHEAATAGEWLVFAEGKLTDLHIAGNNSPIVHWIGFDGSDRPRTHNRANAKAIAALHNAFPSILAERETAQTIPPGYALVPVEQVKDAERLDFLDGNLKFSMGWQVNKAPVGNVGVHSIIFAGRLPVTIREAIDKAMLTAAAKGE